MYVSIKREVSNPSLK